MDQPAMFARDIMTTEALSVGPDTPTHKIARPLIDNGISAVPVVDGRRAPIGMVSEGDLIGRNGADREARRDWWLVLLAGGQPLCPEFLGQLHGQDAASLIHECCAIAPPARSSALKRSAGVSPALAPKGSGEQDAVSLIRQCHAAGAFVTVALASATIGF
jgi:CBS domain-containing protein